MIALCHLCQPRPCSRPSSLDHGRSPPSSSAPTKLSRPPSTFERRRLRHLLPTRHPSRCLGASKLYLGRLRPLPSHPMLDFQIGTSVVRPPPRMPQPSRPDLASKSMPRCLQTPPQSPPISAPIARRTTPNRHFGHLTSIPDASTISSRPGIQVGTSVPPNSTSVASNLRPGCSTPDNQIGTSVIRPPPRTPPPPSTSEQLFRPPSAQASRPPSKPPASEQALGLPQPPGEAPSDVSASLGSLWLTRPPSAFERRRSRPPSASEHGCSRPPSASEHRRSWPPSASRRSPFGCPSLPWLPLALPASLGLQARMLPASIRLSSQDQSRTTLLGTDSFSEARSMLN